MTRPIYSISTVAVSALLAAPASAAISDGFTVEVLPAPGDVTYGWSTADGAVAVGWTRVGGTDQGLYTSPDGATAVAPLAGHSRCDLVAVNEGGAAVGTSGNTSDGRRGIVYQPGRRLQTLPTLGGADSSASHIDEDGRVAGWAREADGTAHAVIWEDGLPTPLEGLGGAFSQARWIGEDGWVVGDSQEAGSTASYAVMWSPEGTLQRLPPEGGIHIAYMRHKSGTVAGFARYDDFGGGNARATLWRDGEVALRLSTLAEGTSQAPFAASTATDLNTLGMIVGMSVNGEGSNRVYVYHDGEMTQLDTLTPPGWAITSIGPGGLSEDGRIVATGSVDGGPPQALLLTPLSPPLLGDLTGDDAVTFVDLARAFADQGCTDGLEQCPGDANFDGQSTAEDIRLVLAALLRPARS